MSQEDKTQLEPISDDQGFILRQATNKIFANAYNLVKDLSNQADLEKLIEAAQGTINKIIYQRHNNAQSPTDHGAIKKFFEILDGVERDEKAASEGINKTVYESLFVYFSAARMVAYKPRKEIFDDIKTLRDAALHQAEQLVR